MEIETLVSKVRVFPEKKTHGTKNLFFLFWPVTCLGDCMRLFKMFHSDTPTPSESPMSFQGEGMVISQNCK